jgi:hypothetical protein
MEQRNGEINWLRFPLIFLIILSDLGFRLGSLAQ